MMRSPAEFASRGELQIFLVDVLRVAADLHVWPGRLEIPVQDVLGLVAAAPSAAAASPRPRPRERLWLLLWCWFCTGLMEGRSRFKSVVGQSRATAQGLFWWHGLSRRAGSGVLGRSPLVVCSAARRHGPRWSAAAAAPGPDWRLSPALVRPVRKGFYSVEAAIPTPVLGSGTAAYGRVKASTRSSPARSR